MYNFIMEEIIERLEKLIEKPKKADPQPEEYYEQHMRGYTMTIESLWIETDNNPTGRRVGDCAVRAVSIALGADWETASALPAKHAYLMGDRPSSDSVRGSVLRDALCQIVTTRDDKHHHARFRGVYELKRPPPPAGQSAWRGPA